MSVINLTTGSNELEVLTRQLKREVEELVKTTDATLLRHDGKITELCLYIKDNLSNTLRDLFDVLKTTGELDEIISETLLNLSRNNIINITEYGIVPGLTYDGNLDDVINNFPEGATLYFPKGTYTFNTSSAVMTLIKPITILGDGEDSTIIQNIGYGNIIDIKLETPEKRFVYIEKLTLDEVDEKGHCVEVLSENGYYLAQFRMRDVKTINGTHGFYLEGITNDNLFLSAIEHCTIWNGFYANKIGDTIKITNCQFAFNGGVYINQVAGASSLEFSNNNVTCTNGFIIEGATAPIIINNIFEFTRKTNNTNGFVEIVPTSVNRQYEYTITSNTFSYASGFTEYNKPLLFIGKIGKSSIEHNMIGVKENNYSVVLSNLSNSIEFNNTFGVAYNSSVIAYSLLNQGTNNKIIGHYIDGEFVDGIVTSKTFEKYTSKKLVNGSLELLNSNPTFSSVNGEITISYGDYVDEYHVANKKVVGAITSKGILPLDLLIGGLTNHVRLRFMQGSLPTDDLQNGDVFINKAPSTTYPYLFYYYNGTSFKGAGKLETI